MMSGRCCLPPANSTADRDETCSRTEPVAIPAPTPIPATDTVPGAPDPPAPECGQAEAGGASGCVCCEGAPFGGARDGVWAVGAPGASNSGTGTAANKAG